MRMFEGMEIGILDCNGRKIKEGDTVYVLHSDWISKDPNDQRSLDEYLRSISFIGVVTYKPKNQCFVAEHDGEYEYLNYLPHGRIQINDKP